MKLRDVTEVLSFAAFRPEPDDATALWPTRFPRRRGLILNISRSQTTWRGISRAGAIVDISGQQGDFKDVAEICAEEWRSLTDDGWCIASINSRYVISLETNLSRKAGGEDLVRTNPRAVLGARHEKGKRYALASNPESSANLLLACDEDQIKRVEETLVAHRLRVGRIACGTFALLRRLLEEAHTTADTGRPGNPPPAPDAPARLYVVCNEGSVCALLENGHLWRELRSRSDLYSDDYRPVFEILDPLIARLNAGGEIHFAADMMDSEIARQLEARAAGARLRDFSSGPHLWKILSDR